MTRSGPTFEFIALVALLNAMVALSIDTMLPALGTMAEELAAASANDRQLVITTFFAGVSLGVLVYGPLSDTTGRKPAIFAGLGLYGLGTILCMLATSFPVLLLGRTIQGFGAAAPRVVSIAMVRDGSAGPAMARVMSFVMSVFMVVPILAPGVGQLILLVADWRTIFVMFFATAAIATLWLALRQAETLPRERRSPLSPAALLSAAGVFFGNAVAFGYTLAAGFIFGAFINYLSTSQQIFAEQYGQGKWFALWFAVFALALGIAMQLNGRLVMRFGMRTLSKFALRAEILWSAAFLLAALPLGGHPPLWLLGTYLFVNFFFCGILFGNYNALAMEPMGRIAGMAAAMSGALSQLMALSIGGLVGRFYDGTVIPLAAAYAGLGLLAFIASEWAERRRT